MKKLPVLLLTALLLAALCGCGGSGTERTGGSEPSSSALAERQEAEIVMDFTGDINLDDSWYVMDALHAAGGTISDAIDPALIQRMKPGGPVLRQQRVRLLRPGDTHGEEGLYLPG